MVKICIISIFAKKIFFGKIICSTHQRSVSPQCYAIFGKLNFWRNIDRRGLTKMVKICIILTCAKKILFGKIICPTHQKKCFSTILGNFWKIEFLKEYQQTRTLQKFVKICIILNCAKKFFFGKIICSTHQRKCFSTILGNFGKLNFWRNIDRRGPYKNGENLYYLNLC